MSYAPDISAQVGYRPRLIQGSAQQLPNKTGEGVE